MSSADPNALRENNAPSTDTLAQMSPESIYAALTTGAMVQQAGKLSDDEKRLLAGFFGGRPVGTADAGDIRNMANHCAANPQMANPSAGASWNGWGNDLMNTRFQPAKAESGSGVEPEAKVGFWTARWSGDLRAANYRGRPGLHRGR
jgi:hypothetical protein